MTDFDMIPDPTPEQIAQREHASMIARMKAEIARRQRARAMQGYVEIKASDFN
jgi:hypothetical protein